MRRVASSACFTLGVIWTAAGVFKLLFGVQLTLPLLPPLGLERVTIGPSIAIGLALFAAGALIARSAKQDAGSRFVEAFAVMSPASAGSAPSESAKR